MAEIGQFFDILRENCDIRATSNCSMHTHVSLCDDSSNPYSASQLRSIAKAIMYWDDAIEQVLPGARKAHPFCPSNVNNTNASALPTEQVSSSLKKAYREVSRKTFRPVFEAVNRELVTVDDAEATMGKGRDLAWSFRYVTGGCGTIEYRQPPGVEDAVEARHWIAFTLGFVAETLSGNFDRYAPAKESGHPVALRDFISRGAQRVGAKEVLGRLRPDLSLARVYTKKELEVLRWKKGLKDREESPFAIKVRYHIAEMDDSASLT